MKLTKLFFVGIVTLTVAAGYRMASTSSRSVPIDQLELSSESRVPVSTLEKLSGTKLMAAVISGNFPDAVTSGNFPDAVTSGNFPNAVTSGNFPNFRDALGASGSLPSPKVASR